MSLIARERSFYTSDYWVISGVPTLELHKNVRRPQPPVGRPKVDVQFPHLWFSTSITAYRLPWNGLTCRQNVLDVDPPCSGGNMFSECPDVRAVYAVGISFASHENWTDFDKNFQRWDNHYHQQMNSLHFGRNWNRYKRQVTTENSKRCQTGAVA